MSLIVKTATVYQAPTSSRRYLSKQAAYMRWACDLLRARFEVEHLVNEDFDGERYRKVAPRLARWLRWSDSARGEP